MLHRLDEDNLESSLHVVIDHSLQSFEDDGCSLTTEMSHQREAYNQNVCDEEWIVSTHITTIEGVAGRNEYLVLDEPCDAGSVLCRVQRTSSSVVPSPSWDTLQIGATAHARFGAKALKVNHAQDPNCRVEIHEDRVEIISLVAMPEGVTLTFNYNTTEYSMAEPFIDWVTGSLVGGFKNAGHEEQQKLISSGLVAAHVLELFHASGMVLNPSSPLPEENGDPPAY